MRGVGWFGLLGPLEVRAADRPVRVNGRRQGELLAVLALRANQFVSVEVLVDLLWPDQPPASARRQVQNGVGRLRRTLTAGGLRSEVIETWPGGYLLRAEHSELDTLSFARDVAAGERLAAAGRAADAVTSWRAALRLWRGAPLAGIDNDLVAREARRLQEQRLAVLEKCVELELRLGRAHEVAGELAEVAAEHPLRERLWAALVLALHQDGRGAEALAVYRRARAGFRAELGVEPGPELRAARQVITGTSMVDTAPRPRQLPPDTADFTGRDELVSQLERLFRGRHTGRAVVISAIAGPAGVGKTTLAVHVAHRLLDAYPDGQLYVDLGGGAPAPPVEPGEVLARFLRALGVAGPAIPDGVDERTALYRSRLGDRRILVVLDNAVDEAQVRPLLPGVAGCGVLITSRPRLAAVPGARRITLAVLEPGQATELLGRIAGADRVAAEPSAALEVARLCGFLPLALRIAGARLVRRPDWTIARLGARLGDESVRLSELRYGDLEVRASLAVSYRGLGQRQRRLFHLLGSLTAPDVAGWVCAALLDLPVGDEDEAVAALTDAQLLETVGADATGGQRYRLHDLVRLYARERAALVEPAGELDAALRRALGGWLALVDRAHVALSGGDFATMRGCSPRWTPVTDAHGAAIDADPLAWFEAERAAITAGVRQAADAGWDELCWELAVGAYALFLTRGHYDDWADTHTTALRITLRERNRRGAAAARLGLGILHAYRRDYAEAAPLLDHAVSALREVGNRRELSYALGTAAHVDGMRGRYALAIPRQEESIATHHALGDRVAEVLGLRALGKLLVDFGRPDRARPLLSRAIAMGDHGDRRAHAEAVYTMGQIHLVGNEFDRAEAAFRQMLEICEEIGDLRGEASARYGFGLVRLATGDLDAAEVLLRQALEVNRRLGAAVTDGRIRLALGELYRRRREVETAIGHLEESARIFAADQTPLWQARAQNALGDAFAAQRNHRAARAAWTRAGALFTEVGSHESAEVAGKLDRLPPTPMTNL
ncbi:AfsR/SARP family transcriptional regulator [Actinophytocola sp.]|uniref:AfsR/SARP family transcriptional regulator n=1 Tax=Actinophytocola sp. TaxID=1872138 RepID=UPI002D7F547A|nr:BTAD domain-containing putative transcriptional regulator [Actinophytocola sp.]HET9139146.1 BTAD domain-containing putative transcriptional regulator [Actinophytocola sp.]